MNFRHLSIQLLLTLAVLVAANLAVRQLATNSVPRQLLRKGEQSEPATDLFLGNSTMAAGIDEAAFIAANPGSRPLNLGLGSSGPVEHYLLYRRQNKHAPLAIYYGFLDTQLTDPPDGSWDALVGNRAMAYYVDPDVAASFYAADSPLRSFALRLVALVPVLVERQTIWARVEMMRRYLGEFGMPPKETNRFGRAEDFALLEAAPEEFVRRCEHATANRTPLTEAVAAIFYLAKERGSTVYVVEMPMPLGHRQRYYSCAEWRAYRAHLVELVRVAGGTYVEADNWIGDDGFADHLHLNADGATSFSTRLGELVRRQR